MNNLATKNYESVVARGLLPDSLQEQILFILEEYGELMQCGETSALLNPEISRVIPQYTHLEEEAADVILATMTLLKMKWCNDIEDLLRAKIEYNLTRR